MLAKKRLISFGPGLTSQLTNKISFFFSVGIAGWRRCIVSLAIYKKELTAKTGPTHKSAPNVIPMWHMAINNAGVRMKSSFGVRTP